MCGLFGCDCMVIMRFSAYFRLVMASLIHFRVTLGKWLESACNVLICGLYDDTRGAAGARVYAGRFTLVESDFILLKSPSDEHARHLNFLTYRAHRGGGVGFNPKI